MPKKFDASKMSYKELNEQLREESGECVIENTSGHRFIACGQSNKHVKIIGVPGNALGAYLDGAEIEVMGNAQDATGDTMNNGKIIIHGNSGDATGYAMRGGEIYVENNVGYRAGIHMKSYKDTIPTIIIGGKAGSFLAEYQAGGRIILLGIGYENEEIVGDFCGTGMHGGKLFIRKSRINTTLPSQVCTRKAEEEDIKEISPYIKEYSKYFNKDFNDIISSDFLVLTPNSKNPYKQLYVAN